MTWEPWANAWQRALYGANGFYRSPAGPAEHFATSTQGAPDVGAVFARAIVRLAHQSGLGSFVDVGCGRGELLTAVHRLAPELACTGVEVCPRPDLDGDIAWLTSPGGARLPDGLSDLHGALVLANEWLDVVPCTIAEWDGEHRLREVLVNPRTGQERLGDELAGPSLDWCQRHWPVPAAVNGRVEVGLARDDAWADLLGRLRSGVGVAVDYSHTRSTRPAEGTLTAYRHGHQVAPIPDCTCDLTAHVAMDTLVHDELVTQREALHRLGVDGRLPPRDLAGAEPLTYLAALGQAGAATALTAVSGLGAFWWAFVTVDA